MKIIDTENIDIRDFINDDEDKSLFEEELATCIRNGRKVRKTLPIRKMD